MTDDLLGIVTTMAALGSGVMAGVFFAFSTFVMFALGRLPSREGIAAMKAINVEVINPWFLSVFLGTTGACVVLAIASVILRQPTASVLAGSVLYFVGTFLVTVLFNVPRNNELEKADATTEEGARLWARYLETWTAWNHVRTIAALAATYLFMIAF